MGMRWMTEGKANLVYFSKGSFTPETRPAGLSGGFSGTDRRRIDSGAATYTGSESISQPAGPIYRF